MMSCIKFPSNSNDLRKTSSKEEANGYLSMNSHLIDTANNVFGEGNWSHSITNQTVDFIDKIIIGDKYQAGCATMVKVQLKNGTFHEGIGYSNLEGSTKGSTLQKVRLDSLNMALKHVFSCFGNEFSKKLKSNAANRTISPVPKQEVLQKMVVHKERSVSPIAPSTNMKNTEVFDEEVISLSQTDAFIGTVDLDQIIDKSSKSNVTNNSVKDFTATSVLKPIDNSSTLTEKDKNSNNVNNNNYICAKTKIPISNPSHNAEKQKKENQEVPKPILHSAMTDEEMRLERKRKQREMQEEFKRKQESKKMHVEGGSKPAPNPRY